ncbi:hypothetical protein EVY07_08905 [Enterobacter hormaechei]|nr:hypothetical protein EVY07_08905 [Enterobacter hormaechei]
MQPYDVDFCSWVFLSECFDGVVAGVEPASIGALPIGLRAPCGYLSRIFTAKLFPSSPLSFTTPRSTHFGLCIHRIKFLKSPNSVPCSCSASC